MEYPFYPLGYGFIPIVHDSSREYFDSLPQRLVNLLALRPQKEKKRGSR